MGGKGEAGGRVNPWTKDERRRQVLGRMESGNMKVAEVGWVMCFVGSILTWIFQRGRKEFK